MEEKQLFRNKIDIKNGLIYNIKGTKTIGKRINNSGYNTCSIFDSYGNLYCFVHQVIMAEALQLPKHLWLKDENGYVYEVDHINNIRTDNRIDNLQLITKAENNKKRRTKNYKPKIKHTDRPNAKKVYQYTLSGELVKVWKSTSECGRNGFAQNKVSNCCLGGQEKHKGYRWSYKPL